MTRPAGFTAVPNWLIRSTAITTTAKAVYLALASHADRDGVCWPSHDTIAAEAGVSVGTVKTALTALRGIGAVDWKRTRGSNRYVVTTGDRPPRLTADSQPTAHPVSQPTAYKQDPVEQDPRNNLPAADASEPILAAVPDALFSSDEVETAVKDPNGGDLFDAWVQGFQETYGHAPDPVCRGPLLNAVTAVVKSRTDTESWRTAWRAFKAAGRKGDTNVRRYLLGTQSGFVQTSPYAAAMNQAAANGHLDYMFGISDTRPAIGGTA